MRSRSDGVPPAAGRLSSVHLAKKQSQHGLSILPIKVSQLNGDTLISGEQTCTLLLLALLKVGLLAVFRRWVDQGQKLRLLGSLNLGHVFLKFQAFLLFNLLHGLEEELFDIGSLVEDHLADSADVLQLLVFYARSLSQVAKLLSLLLDDLLILELQ